MKIMDFEGTGIVVLSDDDPQAPTHVRDTHQMYVYMYVCMHVICIVH
jgi:hypothetical protein